MNRWLSRPDLLPPAPGATAAPSPGGRIVVGIGEFAVSCAAGGVIVTHALGSCIAVCVRDPVTRVTGLLHFLLPDSRVNPVRALEQPASFADTGIPLLFQTAYRLGLDKRRCRVQLVGGAETNGGGRDSFNVGKRNVLAARNLLWRSGLMIQAEATGGTVPRTVSIAIDTGRVAVATGREVAEVG